MPKLRTYAPMARQSEKVKAERVQFQAVYAQVDARSEGRCEFVTIVAAESFVDPYGKPLPPDHRLLHRRCTRRATDHHHCVKPRRVHHDPALIVHLCRAHHDRCEWPYQRGRLVVTPLGEGRFRFEVRYVSPKAVARG